MGNVFLPVPIRNVSVFKLKQIVSTPFPQVPWGYAQANTMKYTDVLSRLLSLYYGAADSVKDEA